MDYESINKHLELLRRFVADLVKFKENLTIQEFKSNNQIQYDILFAFLEAVQCCIDIGNHLISELELGRAENYKQIFDILYKNEIINEDLEKKLEEFAQVRNQIVHLYIIIDLEPVYNIIEKDIDYFNQFEKSIINFLKQDN